MRAWLLVCAALALAPGRPRAASATPAATAAPPAPPAHTAHTAHSTHTAHTAHTSHLATITHTTHDSQTAHSAHQAHSAHSEHSAHPHTLADPARLDHIKTQILAKLGLRTRPRPLGAPPRDVVRQNLARAADTHTERPPDEDHSMREIIAIAHRGLNILQTIQQTKVHKSS
ncbi:hypothetical protein RR46_12255 [Papilio xuthus]|uniref:Uncharacterized protein n=1 Tax=Papilio xuthus TaxID=66420 RepID=A0A194PP88_PAPXU|nr:hypothetical protein RR46_12255 [Papilio xuthus]